MNILGKLATLGVLGVLAGSSPVVGDVSIPEGDVLMRALVDELERSVDELVIEGLAKPYYIQYAVEDQAAVSIVAQNGGLTRVQDSRSRRLTTRVRVGSYDLDNTNFMFGFGGLGLLPVDDDYTALRHAIWLATDQDYKQSVEALTRKEAYLKQVQIEDRPADWTKGDPVRVVEPAPKVKFDQKEWERKVTQLSKRFRKFPEIQDAQVNLSVAAASQYLVNSEGARLRTSDTGVILEARARLQAVEGMVLRDQVRFIALQIDELPDMDEMLADVDAMCERLVRLAKAQVPEQYSGPVLFAPHAAAQVFQSLLAGNLAAIPSPIGMRRGSAREGFDKKIGTRILPRSMSIYDDPRPERFGDKLLAGFFSYDDEGVPAQRVNLVEGGILKTLVSSRAPTKKIKESNGHARSPGFGDARASAACLYIEDEDGLSDEELTKELIEAARDEGLDYGIRVDALVGGGFGRLGSPLYAYKVYVEDGREELIRGMRFLPVEVRSLKRLLAVGEKREVYNSISQASMSIVSPAILFEELELTKVEQEFDKPPILKPPSQRGGQ